MTYKTDNIAIASALRTFGYIINEIQINGRKATFIFDDEAVEAANHIYQGSRLVDALTFHQELRRLSSLAKSMVTQEIING